MMSRGSDNPGGSSTGPGLTETAAHQPPQDDTWPMLKHAVRADLPTVVDIWVEAFADDPFFRWIAPEDETWQGFGRDWLTLIGGLCFERGHTFVGEQAAIAWVPPDLALVGADDVQQARDLIATHAGEARADEALAVIMEARGHALEEPHWTLQYIGIRRADQGFGIGAAVAALGLAVADRDGRPCTLTSTNARNVPFYERLGFTVAAEVAVPGAEAALRPMVRTAGARISRGRHTGETDRISDRHR